jgi:hypothetical protein
MKTIYKQVSNHVDAPFIRDNEGKRVPKGVVFNVNDLGFNNGVFLYQNGFKRRRAFADEQSQSFRNGYRLYKMRGGWFCIENVSRIGGGTFAERFEVKKAEAFEIEESAGAACEKIFNACKNRAF